MRILRCSRPKLLALVHAKLRDNAREAFDAGDVTVCGAFVLNRWDWYVGLRVKRGTARPIYYRIREESVGRQFYRLIVRRCIQPFNWRHYKEDVYQGDNPRACARLRWNHECKHLSGGEAATATQGQAGAQAQAREARQA
jgi:hypothetical protein